MKRLHLSTPLFIAISCCFPLASDEVDSSIPMVSHAWNLDVRADWLYWKANETGLSYALNQDFFKFSSLVSMGSGNAAHPKFDWQSGFRVGIGYTVPRDHWDISLLWTWNEGKGSDSQTSNNDAVPTILPIFIHPNVYNDESIVACMEASDDVLIHLNLIDLDLGRKSKLGKCFGIHPHLGLRSAWINQIHNVDYHNLFDSEKEEVLKTYHTHMTNKFWGLGPRIGIGADFNLGVGLSLVSDVSLSLLYGLFEITHSEQFAINSHSEGTILAEGNNFHSEALVTDVELGLRWSRPFFKERIRLTLQAGWEHHMFLSQNQLMHFVDGQNWANFIQNQGDLSFQGWTGSIRFFF
jgi:hypothetical protein